jgi:hypothetical protein
MKLTRGRGLEFEFPTFFKNSIPDKGEEEGKFIKEMAGGIEAVISN